MGKLGRLDKIAKAARIGDLYLCLWVYGANTKDESSVVARRVATIYWPYNPYYVGLGHKACNDAVDIAGFFALWHIGKDILGANFP